MDRSQEILSGKYIFKPSYRNGGNGIIEWIEDNVWAEIDIFVGKIPVSVWVPMGSEYLPDTAIEPITGLSYKSLWCTPNRDTGRSYNDMFNNAKEIFRQALRMEDGMFVHRLIVFCWMRGEGKSFNAVLIQMWKLCCFPSQDIKFCANSKEQTGHAHYGVARNIALNSPRVLDFITNGGMYDKDDCILVGEIRVRDSDGVLRSKISTISTASGIFSNITGYAFSEIFELKNEDFFTKIDGSIRNKPNAFGVIDSTVSSKEHLLYRLYESYIKKEDPLTFFSYRSSKTGDYRDYWHPNNTQEQLNSYRIKQALKFAAFFLNLWSAGAERIFSDEQVEAINIMGVDRQVDHNGVIELIRRRQEIIDSDSGLVAKGVDVYDQAKEIAQVNSHFWQVQDVFQYIETGTGNSVYTPADSLEVLGDLFDTDWAITCGVDRAQPMKRRTAARTIFTTLAKGLPGSRSDPGRGIIETRKELLMGVKREYAVLGPSYIYILVHLADVADSSMVGIRREVEFVNHEYDGIDVVGAETWQMADIKKDLEDIDVRVEIWHPSYDRQLAAFTELYAVVAEGRLKAAPTGMAGSREDDILLEEIGMFDYDPDKKSFASPEKSMKHGVQDDCVYALGWNIYGGRFLTVENLRPRTSKRFFGMMIQNRDTLGIYHV